MKAFIKRWLGIPEPISETQLRRMVGDAVVAMIENKPEGIYYAPGFTLHGPNNRLTAAAAQSAMLAVESRIQDLPKDAELIDRLVEAINRKQLK